jgi:hypothetical protein
VSNLDQARVVPSTTHRSGASIPRHRAIAAFFVASSSVLAACGGASHGDARTVALAYAAAAERGDADALHGMLRESSKQRIVLEELRAKVAEQREELAERARAVRDPATKIETEARVRFGDGEHARLQLEDGAYRISAAAALPALARTPADALEQLRRVLARRSYAGLVRVLSPRTRAAIEADLRSLVEGLEDPEGLEVVEVSSDTAVVLVPGGHRVALRREGSTWHVDDFD